MTELSRQFFLHGPFGDTQLKEALGSLLASLILIPDEIWLVSPWVSDFKILDNRAGDWDYVQHGWGARYVYFSEMLVASIESGSRLILVTNRDSMNKEFHKKLTTKIDPNLVNWVQAERLHTKGLLCSSFFLSGSMNFTYSGTNRNDERVQLYTNSNTITEAKLEFQKRYDQ